MKELEKIAKDNGICSLRSGIVIVSYHDCQGCCSRNA